MLKPHKAIDADYAKLRFPLWGMPKIDGVRALHVNGKFQSRTLSPFANLALTEYFNHDSLAGLDGELAIGDWTSQSLCRDTTSGTNTIRGPSGKDFEWYLFDDLTHPEQPYNMRYTQLATRVYELRQQGWKNLHVVPFELVASFDEAMQLHSENIGQGFEGTILRNPYEKHKSGRSTTTSNAYLRIKDFVEEEALVLSVEEGETNLNEATLDNLGHTKRSTHQENKIPNGMVGKLICKDVKTGQTITVAAGRMTHEERIHYLKNPQLIVGEHIKYKCMKHGQKDLPRFPTFQLIRPRFDL